MELYRPVHLKTSKIIKEAALSQLKKEWDWKSERMLRMPRSGELFDAVTAEMISLGYGQIALWTIFARGKYNKQVIHVDAWSATERLNAGLLLPVIGCDNSIMQWFDETTVTLTPVVTADGKSVYLRDISSRGDHKVIEEINVRYDILAKVCVPHRAIASDEPRATVSIKFQGNPQLL